jgi:hypothetical protein
VKITNSKGLPEVLVSAARAQQRDPDPNKRSITELLSPAHQRKLQREHWEELEEDVADRIHAILGSGVHAFIAQADGDDHWWTKAFDNMHQVWQAWQDWQARVILRLKTRNWLQEETLHSSTMPVHGTFDAFDVSTGTLWDVKVTSVWKLVNGSSEEWARQLNGYRWLMSEQPGLPEVRALRVMAFLRDWSKNQAKAQPGSYPDSQVQVIELPMWTLDATRAFYSARLAEHVSAVPPLCTPEERWQRPTTWAVMKAGNARALRVLLSHEEAERYIAEKKPKGDVSIEERPGADVRCMDWCSVAMYCEHGRGLLSAAAEPSFAEVDL